MRLGQCYFLIIDESFSETKIGVMFQVHAPPREPKIRIESWKVWFRRFIALEVVLNAGFVWRRIDTPMEFYFWSIMTMAWVLSGLGTLLAAIICFLFEKPREVLVTE